MTNYPEYAQRLKRDLNCLLEQDRNVRRKALIQLNRNYFGSEKQVQEANAKQLFIEQFHKHLLRLYSDGVEQCREISLDITDRFCQVLSTSELEAVIPSLVPALLSRFDQLPFKETAEELRVKALSLLHALINASPKTCEAFVSEICQALAKALTDANPDTKKECASICETIGASFDSVKISKTGKPLIQSLCANLQHQHSKVRKCSLEALRVLLGSEAASVAFMDGCKTAIQHAVMDHSVSVRESAVRAAAFWMARLCGSMAGARFEGYLLLLLLQGSADLEDPEVAAAGLEELNRVAPLADSSFEELERQRILEEEEEEDVDNEDEEEEEAPRRERAEKREKLKGLRAEREKLIKERLDTSFPVPLPDRLLALGHRASPIREALEGEDPKHTPNLVAPLDKMVEDSEGSSRERKVSPYVLSWIARLQPKLFPELLSSTSDWTSEGKIAAIRTLRAALVLLASYRPPSPFPFVPPVSSSTGAVPSLSLSSLLESSVESFLVQLFVCAPFAAADSSQTGASASTVAHDVDFHCAVFARSIACILGCIVDLPVHLRVVASRLGCTPALRCLGAGGVLAEREKKGGGSILKSNVEVDVVKEREKGAIFGSTETKRNAWLFIASVLRGWRLGVAGGKEKENPLDGTESVLSELELEVIVQLVEWQVGESGGALGAEVALVLSEIIRSAGGRGLRRVQSRVFGVLLRLKCSCEGVPIDAIATQLGIRCGLNPPLSSLYANHLIHFVVCELFEESSLPPSFQGIARSMREEGSSKVTLNDLPPLSELADVAEEMDLWEVADPRRPMLELLVRFSGPSLRPFLPVLLPVLVRQGDASEASPPARLDCVVMVHAACRTLSEGGEEAARDASGRQTESGEELNAFLQSVLLKLLLPNLVWRVGQPNATIRKAVLRCLLLLLSDHCPLPSSESDSSHQQQGGGTGRRLLCRTDSVSPVLSAMLKPLKGCLDDDWAPDNRMEGCRLAEVALLVLRGLAEQLVVEQGQGGSGLKAKAAVAAGGCTADTFFELTEFLREIYTDLLARLDDAQDEIRLGACAALCRFFEALCCPYLLHGCQGNRQAVFSKSLYEFCLRTLTVYLDDPSEDIRRAMGAVLRKAAGFDTAMFRTELRDAQKKSSHPHECEEIAREPDRIDANAPLPFLSSDVQADSAQPDGCNLLEGGVKEAPSICQ
uniref:Dynein axonemal assembly factor 5 TPR repeats domain-containing protein n=1 Tax=Chromera velia CCMP2878 TaxID=1169474 RepID=A0A0G4GBI7_9ALVE|eukprot:Cvel_21024.t1-p1 / transcript=Cvel_21024.t1 / gene=Cvel_21024 / organism=Chromera_velia_CCMP2878 / gene_product=hypothetical protein / transcript_product=hypothetical protein / location=Cvel_scaffold1938:16602-24244(+) / protein_length=1181 / sequence_SO=supercontig / SO=protein_coding / is_pseudo=false